MWIQIIASMLIMACFSQVQAVVPDGCNGVRNTQPVLELTPQSLKNVTHGQSWIMQQGTNILFVAKVSGTAHQMGHALGELYGDEIAKNVQNLVDYGYIMFVDLIKDYVTNPWQTHFLYYQVAQNVFAFLLDLNWAVAKPYVPARFIDEMKGIAMGSGGKVNYHKLRRINMVPEITRAACTILGAHNSATADGKLYHLRSLDWQPTALVNQYPSLIIYEPSEAGSITFANIGYLGVVGTLTAMSKIGITVGEKVMYVRNATTDYPEAEPTYTYFGKPWMFVLRDSIQFSKNMHDVENQLIGTKRTVMIHLGYGSVPDNTFRGVDYAKNVLTFYNDKNYTRYAAGSHPQFNGVFFYDRHVQPSGSTCIANILTAAIGSITPETLYRDVAGYHRTGNAQVVVMDPAGQQLWLSFSEFNSTVNAFERSPIHVKLTDFW